MANIFRHPHFQKPKFDPISPAASEIIYPDTDCPDDVHERESKRRRIESLAERYLKGHPLVIHSAVLKGTLRGAWTVKSERIELREGDQITKSSVNQNGNNHKRNKRGSLRGPSQAPVGKTSRTEKLKNGLARQSTQRGEHTGDTQDDRRNSRLASSTRHDRSDSGREPAIINHWTREQRESMTEPPPVGYSTNQETTPSWLKTQNLRSPLPQIARVEHSDDEHATPSKSYRQRAQRNDSEDASLAGPNLHQDVHTVMPDVPSFPAKPQSLQIITTQGHNQTECTPHSSRNLAEERLTDSFSRKALTADLSTRKPTEAKSGQNHGEIVANGAIKPRFAASQPISVKRYPISGPKYEAGFTPINKRPQSLSASQGDRTYPLIGPVLEQTTSAAKQSSQRPVSAAERTNDRSLVELTPSMYISGVTLESHAERTNEPLVSTANNARKPEKESRIEQAKHPFNASPNGPSPGFPFRKLRVSASRVKVAELLTENQQVPFLEPQKQPRFMTFDTPNNHDVKAAMVDDTTRPAASPAAELAGPGAEQDVNKGEINENRQSMLHGESLREDQPSLNLSTQAAVDLAQEAFQCQLVSLEKDGKDMNWPQQSTNSQTRPTTPPTQQSVSEMSPITPFKIFNLHSASAEFRHSGEGEMSTQDLFNAATPFAFSTVKKQNNAKVGMSSPSKHAEATTLASSFNGDPGDETMASVTLASESIPIHQSAVSVSSQQSKSGLKKHSDDPAISPGIAFLKGGPSESQTLLTGTMKSNSTPSAQHGSGGPSPQEELSDLQEGQKHSFMDDIDVNAAIDDAGSFLQSWRLETELPSREKIRSSLVAPVGSQ